MIVPLTVWLSIHIERRKEFLYILEGCRRNDEEGEHALKTAMFCYLNQNSVPLLLGQLACEIVYGGVAGMDGAICNC